MSISGAAVDPNMRFYQSASLTAFLTLLNARLGYWIQNPSRCNTGPQEAELDRREPEAGQPALYRAARPDGGQGGVHPPLRRRPFREHGRVRADPKTVPLHRGLRRGGGHRALRREPRHPDAARPDRLRRSHQNRHRAIPIQGPDGLTRAHVVVGRVHYEDVDQRPASGPPGLRQDLDDRRRAVRRSAIRPRALRPSPTSRPTSSSRSPRNSSSRTGPWANTSLTQSSRKPRRMSSTASGPRPTPAGSSSRATGGSSRPSRAVGPRRRPTRTPASLR